ncbi:MAG: hypothetical protein AAB834_07870, partial [Patescibacteria group bacterium]
MPSDAIEYVVATEEAMCEQREVGCALLGEEMKDQTGTTIGFAEKYLLDDPDLYEDPQAPLSCRIDEALCRSYTRLEDGIDSGITRFKDPGVGSCLWLTAASSPTSKEGWFKAKPDGTYEQCEVLINDIDKAVGLSVTRPRGYCVENFTNRPVLVVEQASQGGTYKTAWCDPQTLSGSCDLTTNTCKAGTANEGASCFFDQNCAVTPATCGNRGIADLLRESVNRGMSAANVRCRETVAQCPINQSQCTLLVDPLAYAENRYYFQIDSGLGSAGCGESGDTVSDEIGCRLFNDTEGGALTYKAIEEGSLSTAAACVDTNTCDANRLIKVKRDRTCGEWLACQSYLKSDTGGVGGQGETFCLARRPCNLWGPDDSCASFDPSGGQQSFTSRDLAASNEKQSQVSHLSGYSNIDFTWQACANTTPKQS